MLQQIETRIKELVSELQQSANHHNALLGAMKELKFLYNTLIKDEPVIASQQSKRLIPN